MEKTIFNQTKGKNSKKLKGFTLVELIVVMVILALLMALAIPQVTKYIDKAGEIAVKSEARSCYTALQAFCAEKYGDKRWSGETLADGIRKDMANGNSMGYGGVGDGVIKIYGTYEKKTTGEIWTTANVPESGYITEIYIK